MKSHVPHFAAAILAAGALGAANAEIIVDPETHLTRAQEPIAQPITSDNADPLVSDLVNALNQDAALKNSKITVSMDNGVVYLTGVSETSDQAKRIAEVAASKAGSGNVVNAIQPARITYQMPQQQEIGRERESPPAS